MQDLPGDQSLIRTRNLQRAAVEGQPTSPVLLRLGRATLGAVILATLAVSCSDPAGLASTSVPARAPAIDITSSCFRGGQEPDLQVGSGFAGSDWNDPHVLKVEEAYWMYASSNLGLPPADPSPVQIYRHVSEDGTNWTLDPITPVLAVAPGQWDQGGNETPSVVWYADQYHLFWTGYPDPWPNLNPFNFGIGHATSPDGVSWAKDASFLLGPSGEAGSFDEFLVGEPAPVVFNDILHLYFTAVGVDSILAAALQVIGLITSDDGTAWTEPKLALKPDQNVYPRTADWVGYSTPNAIVIDENVHLFVDVANDHGDDTWTQEALHHAYSADGVSNWTQDESPLRTLTDFTWTQREIRSPSALVDGANLRLYFAGDNWLAGGPWGIGQMTCSLAP